MVAVTCGYKGGDKQQSSRWRLLGGRRFRGRGFDLFLTEIPLKHNTNGNLDDNVSEPRTRNHRTYTLRM